MMEYLIVVVHLIAAASFAASKKWSALVWVATASLYAAALFVERAK